MTGRDDTSLTYNAPAAMHAADEAADVDYFDADDLEALDTPASGGPSRLPMIVMGIAVLVMLAGGSYVALQIVTNAAPQTQAVVDAPAAMPAPPVEALAPQDVVPDIAPEIITEQPVVETPAAPDPTDQVVTLPPEALATETPVAAEQAQVLEEIPTDDIAALVEELPTDTITLPPEPELTPEDFYEAKDIVKAMSAMQQGSMLEDRVLMDDTDTVKPYIEIKKATAQSEGERNILLAERALAVGRYQMAADLYSEGLALNSKDVRALIGHAIASQNLGNIPQAISDYEAALDLKPDNTEAMINLLGLVQQEQPQSALNRLDTLARKYPSNPGVVAQQALVLAGLGRLSDAGALLDRAITLEPSNPMHYYNRAIVAEQMGDTRTAVENYERSLEVDAIHFAGRKVPRDRVYDRLSQLRR